MARLDRSTRSRDDIMDGLQADFSRFLLHSYS
jgi:hypothetical protein